MLWWRRDKNPSPIGYWVVMRYPNSSVLRYLDVVSSREEVVCIEYLSDRIDNRDALESHLDYWSELLGVKYKGVH